MRSVLAAAGILLVSLSFANGAASQARRGEGALPPGPGQRQVQASCAGCHPLSVITTKHYGAERWEQVVDRMTDRGARVTDADYDLIVTYLARNFGPPAG
jgi:mono/diheme cytochrome c family protein